MTATETILIRLKEWPQAELTRFACKLLALNLPQLQGSITLHYAGGIARKIVVTETKDV